ncbi:MAG: hypothetical protein L0Z55_04020 [Planctomycetes bacterium]|nr:hypothetical protein [Planctomycetota bacterium]
MRLIAVALFSLLVVAAGEAPRRPYLVEELPYLDLEQMDQVRIIVRYREMLGTTFTVESSAALFALPPDVDFPVLRRADLRDIHLAIDCRRAPSEAPGGPIVLAVSAVAIGPNSRDFFALVEPELPSLAPVRRCLIAAWAAQCGKRHKDASFTKRAQDTLLSSLAALLEASIKAGRIENFSWLEAGDAALQGDSRWQKMLIEFANCYGDQREIAETAQKIGLRRLGDKWCIDSEFLQEIGMVRVEGALITKKRALLDDAVRAWEKSRRSSQQLRGLTANQYLNRARERKLVLGMNRAEVALSWGYPEAVTWTRRESVLMEAWFYGERYACLTDGFVFHIQQ